MKKLSVLIALALCLTIGGAYATWTYVSGDILASAPVEMGVGIEAPVVVTTAEGTFTIENNLKYIVKSVSDSDYNTKLDKDTGCGDLVITFTANEHASDNVYNNAVDSSLYIKTTYAQYNSTDIFTVNGTAGADTYAGYKQFDITWHSEGNGVFTCTITADQFMNNYVNLTAIDLRSKDIYDAYAAVLGAGKIQMVVDAD